jgi:hypothetical protein
MFLVRSRHALLGLLLTIVSLDARVTAAQTATRPRPGEVTRAQLEERLRQADSLGRKEEAFLLRTRLRDGDFEVGDQILVSYEGLGLTRRDTLIVGSDRVVRLSPPMGDLSLTGILRFELRDSIVNRVNRYFRNEVVIVTPLLRINVSGAVRAPGFYFARPDALLSDIIMRSAGQDQTTDLRNVVIKRGDNIVWSNEDVQAALGDGMTIEGLALEPGDEVVVGAKAPAAAQGNRQALMQLGLTLLSAILVPIILRRSR